MENLTAKERFAIVSVLDPKADGAAAHPTDDYADMSLFYRAVGIALIGVPDDTETIEAKLIAYSSTAGADATDIATAAWGSAHATNNDNIQIVVETNADDIERISRDAIIAGTNTNPLRYLRFVVTTAVAQGEPLAAILLAFDPRHGPTSGLDLASVVEIKRS